MNGNILNPLGMQHKKSVYVWMKVSLLLVSATIIVLSVLTLFLYWSTSHHAIQHDYMQFDTATIHTKKIGEYKQQLEQHTKKLEKFSLQLPFATYLAAITNCLSNNMKLVKISYLPKKRLLLQGQAYSVLMITEFLEKLSLSPYFSNLQLQNLESTATSQQKKLINFNIVGNIV